jgi:hypothetical protein
MIAGKKGGGSGSFLFCTHDNRFMLKTIPTHEKISFLSEMLPVYCQRVLSDDSQLVRIFGVFMLCVGNYSISLVLMENIMTSTVLHKFDLKGSVYKRRVMKKGDYLAQYVGKVLKDVDFDMTLRSLHIAQKDADTLLKRVIKDVQALESLGIMDFSLIVAVAHGNMEQVCSSKYFFRKEDSEDEYYMIALIDFMQQFDTHKQLESWVKHNLQRVQLHELSAVEPRMYADRFIKYIESILG